MIGLLAAALAAQTVEVPWTGWLPPDDIDYRFDTPNPTPAPFFDGTHTIAPNVLARFVDQACVVWGRTGGMGAEHRCRANGTAAINPNLTVRPELGGEWQGWRDDDVDAVFFMDNINCSTQDCVLGSTWCDAPYLSAVLFRDECDFWLSADPTTLWGTYLGAQGGTSGMLLTAPGKRPGSAFPASPGSGASLDLYNVIMHEMGHSLGLFHADDTSTGIAQDCPPGTYDCPIMSAGVNQSVSYWPQLDEILSLHDRYDNGSQDGSNGLGRVVQYSLWEIDTSGSLFQTKAWTSLPETAVPAAHMARVACRPSTTGGDTNNCMLVTHRTGAVPRFYPLSVWYQSASAGTAVSPSNFSEHGVDVAYGRTTAAGDRYLGIGKRPVTVGTASRVVVYRGAVGGATPTSLVLTGSTHTEPRVTYMEPRSVFVAAWPATTGAVTLATFTVTGSLISTVTLTDNTGNVVQTVWPVEVACDNHLLGTSYACLVYVQPYSNTFAGAPFRPHVYSVTVDANGNVVAPTAAAPTIASNAGLLLVDTATYGSSFLYGQWGHATYLLSTDRLREFGTNTIAVQLDATGFFNPADFITNTSMGSGDDARLTNLTSWDWDEASAQIVAVRMGPYGGIQ